MLPDAVLDAPSDVSERKRSRSRWAFPVRLGVGDGTVPVGTDCLEHPAGLTIGDAEPARSPAAGTPDGSVTRNRQGA